LEASASRHLQRGLDKVLRSARHGFDIDFLHAGRDYSRDILSCAGLFEAHVWD
jgi:hypothetical protein